MSELERGSGADSEGSSPSTQTQFLRVLAHELRNYVAPIQNAMHLLRLRARNDPSLLPIAEIIERQAAGMLRTLDTIGEAERANRGELTIERASVDLASIVSRALESVRPLLDARRIRVEVDGIAGLPAVEVDANRMARVLASVLDNAARYSPEGTRVELHADVTGDAVDVRIADEGPGIDVDDPHRFDFFAAPHRAGHGLGLGLPLAKALVALHGGSLSVARRAARSGTEVVIRLPLTGVGRVAADGEGASAGGPRAASEPAAAPARPAAGGQGRRVLIADDSAAIRASLGDLLQDLGHEVRAAADGAEALAMAQAWRPEFVLLDIHMPKLNGFEAARRLRALYPSSVMQLVLISGDDLDETIRRGARQAGFDHCVDKGLAIGELTDILARGASA